MSSPLQYLVRDPKIPIQNPPLLLLLHGVGSNERDLFALADVLPESFLVISVRGPLTLGRDRFGWYEISFNNGIPKIDLSQQEKSHQLLLQFLAHLHEEFSFDETNVWIGGFSQGAVMSYSVGLEHPEEIKGILALSGRLLEETKQKVNANRNSKDLAKQQKIYISHGTGDNVIPVTAARSAKEYLESTGLNPHYEEYTDGHTINQAMLNDLVDWLEKEL